MPTLSDVLPDLAAEGDELAGLVGELPSSVRALPTPAPGWTVGHQLGHLAWTDQVSLIAATDDERFAEQVSLALANASFVDDAAEEWSQRPELLSTWRAGRAALAAALAEVPDGVKLPWFGPPMSATSMATARLMETWAHGQDVADALGMVRTPTERLRHIAHIGVRTREFAFAARGLPAPAEPFRVSLTAPSGQQWTWGPDDAAQQVRGPALDFCLLVTQRRHRTDLAVVATGADADRWLDIAQAFAGPPGDGREPGAPA